MNSSIVMSKYWALSGMLLPSQLENCFAHLFTSSYDILRIISNSFCCASVKSGFICCSFRCACKRIFKSNRFFVLIHITCFFLISLCKSNAFCRTSFFIYRYKRCHPTQVHIRKKKRRTVLNPVSLIIAASLQPLGMLTLAWLLLHTIPIHLFCVIKIVACTYHHKDVSGRRAYIAAQLFLVAKVHLFV